MASKRDDKQLNRRDMGLTGALIVIAQVISSFHSTSNLSRDIDEMRQEFVQVKSDTEKYFVKKEELGKVVVKLDKMNDQLVKIGKQIKSVKDLSQVSEEDLMACDNLTDDEGIPSLLVLNEARP